MERGKTLTEQLLVAIAHGSAALEKIESAETLFVAPNG
jgi:hypothetical protein